jgi:DNA-binding NarL/FixJ family response regulator
MVGDLLKLTTREREIVAGLARGDTNKAIAKKLGLSPHTVRTYLHTLYRKLGVPNRAAAVAKCALGPDLDT